MKKNSLKVDELINEGNHFNFENNKKFTHNQFFSKASPDFLAWVSKVEDYIMTNFDENSGPFKMMNSVNKAKFSGYYQSEFETEFDKLKGAINSCKYLKSNKKVEDNFILSLIKNPLFWTVLVIVIGGAYKLGYDNGIAKFDNEKIELNKENTVYKDTIRILENKLIQLKKSLNQKR